MRVRKVPGTEPGTQRSLKNVTYYFYDGFSALCGRCCWLSKPRPPAPLPLLPVTPLGSPTPASLRSGSVGPARGHTLSSPKLVSVTPSLLLMTGVVWGVLCGDTREDSAGCFRKGLPAPEKGTQAKYVLLSASGRVREETLHSSSHLETVRGKLRLNLHREALPTWDPPTHQQVPHCLSHGPLLLLQAPDLLPQLPQLLPCCNLGVDTEGKT